MVVAIATTYFLAGSPEKSNIIITDKNSQTDSSGVLKPGKTDKPGLSLESKCNGWDDTSRWDEWD